MVRVTVGKYTKCVYIVERRLRPIQFQLKTVCFLAYLYKGEVGKIGWSSKIKLFSSELVLFEILRYFQVMFVLKIACIYMTINKL